MPITTTPSGGPQGEFSTYTPIYATTLSSNTVSITFSNIPTTFTDLVLVVNGKSVTAGSGANGMRSFFNNDSSSLYSETGLSGDGTSASSYRLSSTTYLNLGDLPQASAGPSANIINIMNYSSTTTNKTVITRNNTPSSGLGTIVGLYRSTSPITSMTLTRDGSINIASGTTFTLYGIKAAATKFIPTKAAGGDIVASDGTYAYHAFTTSGIFKPAQSITADVLVIAGGGGTGNATGGGGAGGVIYATSQSLTNQNYAVTIGSGGANSNTTGIKGNNSVFGSLITANGGGAGNRTGGSNANGGSGGGVATGYTAGTASAGSGGTGYANAGATGASGYGGGGGAGAPGGTNTGGNGLNTWSSWATATSTGVSGYYAGGGGGASNPTAGSNAGGLGGGGASGNSPSGATGGAGVPATINTGSGAGGGGVSTSDGPGAAGGSGIVIVRYTL